MKNDGTVYGCGENDNGELGLGNTNNPILVPTKINVSNVEAAAVCNGKTTFVLTDGSVYGYAPNADPYGTGNIGLGNVNTTVPTLIVEGVEVPPEVVGDPNWKPSKGTPALLLTEHADEVYNN